MKTKETLNVATYYVVDEIQETIIDIISNLSNRFNHLDKKQLDRNIKKVLIEEYLLIDFDINISLK